MSPLVIISAVAVGVVLGSIGTVTLLLWLPGSTAVKVAVERMAWQAEQTRSLNSIKRELDVSSQRLVDTATDPAEKQP